MTQVAEAPSLPRKPIAARQLEATGRARDLAVRVTVVRAGRHYLSASQSTPGTVHEMTRTGEGWGCTCRGFAFTGCCKHLGAVARRADREGWSFGAVARPAVSASTAVAIGPWVTLLDDTYGGKAPYVCYYDGPEADVARPVRRFWTAHEARTEADLLNAAHTRELALAA